MVGCPKASSTISTEGKAMPCSSCGWDNPPGASFCEGCGKPLGQACSSCGKTLGSSARFCGSCGRPVGREEIEATPPPVAEAAVEHPRSFAEGRYEVIRCLGAGGMKRVYLARDDRLDRDVAIGLLHARGLDEVAPVRARREANAMAILGDHPNIVTIHDRPTRIAWKWTGP
jgi:hypothetical protein